MRIIDADKFLEDMKSTDRYFMVKFDIERAPTVDLWKYPSRGEYPTDGDKYLVVLFKDEEEPHIAEVKDGWFKHPIFSEYLCEVNSGNVVAWQYIVLPKEEA